MLDPIKLFLGLLEVPSASNRRLSPHQMLRVQSLPLDGFPYAFSDNLFLPTGETTGPSAELSVVLVRNGPATLGSRGQFRKQRAGENKEAGTAWGFSARVIQFVQDHIHDHPPQR